MKSDKEHRVYKVSFASVYPLYVQKAERKKRTQEEVDKVICWLMVIAMLKVLISTFIDLTSHICHS